MLLLDDFYVNRWIVWRQKIFIYLAAALNGCFEFFRSSAWGYSGRTNIYNISYAWITSMLKGAWISLFYFFYFILHAFDDISCGFFSRQQ
jgi:hypothetical protein